MAVLKRLWADPVWSKVIAAGIIAASGAAVAYVMGLWPSICSGLAASWRWLGVTTPTWNWLLLILGAATVFLVYAILNSYWQTLSKPQPNLKNYRTDVILNIRWRWNYYYDGISSLHSFCTICDYQIFPTPRSRYMAVDHVQFVCDNCGEKLAEFDFNDAEVESRIKRTIQQKLRSGEWQAVVAQQSGV
ncbi:MAG: hypothetical protein WD672_15410 [Woeseia sp.]